MVVGTDPTTNGVPTGGPASKREVVRELGELALVLPSLVNQALEANDRAKYYLTLLQAAGAHARRPGSPGAVAARRTTRCRDQRPMARPGRGVVGGERRRRRVRHAPRR